MFMELLAFYHWTLWLLNWMWTLLLKLNGIPVLKVSRRGAEAVHFVEKELKVGEEVVIKIDWERRWDHMQQHSGQE